MGNDARRKQRQKLKRQKKRASLQRAAGASPYSKLKQAGEIEACYINEDWEEEGIASILVLRALPGGGHALGAFLVDFLCIGLKDCWGRIDVSRAEFRESLDRARSNMTMRISPEEAWELVAGGVRWSLQNGFRLPPRYERWISVLGNPADCASADISSFGKQGGGLVYMGSIEDLRKRLIGCTLEQFMAREDVKIISHDLDPGLLDEFEDDEDSDEDSEEEDEDELMELAEAEEAVEELVAVMRSKTLDAVRKFLFSRSIQPHPRLKESVDLLLEAIMQSPGTLEEDDEETEQHAEAAGANLDRFLSLEPPDSRAELQAATDQLSEYMRQFENPADMIKSLGLDDMLRE
jgi:hypothetical protein